MTNKTSITKYNMLRYRSPKIDEIPVTMQGVLCQSGGEYDVAGKDPIIEPEE